MSQTAVVQSASPTLKPTRGKRKVEHLWWVAEQEVADTLGVHEVPSVCRRAWVSTTSGPRVLIQGTTLDDGRRIVTNALVESCKVCVRIVEQRG